jgi:8-oxo-dGTP pyrophosphatase MutT (NUDIX family)
MQNKKYIVTSFLRYHGKILLLQRSSKVSTYTGKWAGCSGYLEEKNEDPDKRAIIEIQEELKIPSDQITLIKKGDPLEIIDKKTTWVVHPYLFETETDQIQLDWEHQNYIWLYPEEIETINLETVPKLRETFDQVKE